ncbi:hypothetical protein M5K25_025263 [Dendrobium thyrsiflorum]|uniref:Transmembrane protein n=1 Tax=Dendrobium thyrsiflorum TaxID=117978 RepID=A0ABD0U403_DENTH
MTTSEQDYGIFSELCSLLFSALRSPMISIPFADTDAPSPTARSRRPIIPVAWGRLPPISPAGMVSLFLGVSLALMLCGSVTFFIGFMMMPWVLGMMFLLYFLGIISFFSGLCKAALISQTPSPDPLKTCQNDINGHTTS